MDLQIQAHLDAMQAIIDGLQGQLAAAAAAPAVGPAAAINHIDAGTLAAALNAARTKDHSKDLDHIAEFSMEGPLRSDDFIIKNVKGTFMLKSMPEVDKVPLVITSLTCKALTTFKAFKNANCNADNCHTTTFAELHLLLLSVLSNLLVEPDALEKEYIVLHQTHSVEKFVEKYSYIVSKINLNLEAKKLHTD
eukprot:1932755-Rhodomonas_salina.2